MDKPTKQAKEPLANEQAMRAREQAVSNRETWVRAREATTGEHEVLVKDREEAVALHEEQLRARAAVADAQAERERLLVQMREANERLVLAAIRAEELAEQARTEHAVATESAAREAEGRRRAEALAAQLRASESAARESSRAKDDFLAILGHELRNPLAPILLALDLIALNLPDPHPREHAIIGRQARHLQQLVDDLLDASRIRSGKLSLRCEPIELAEVVSRAVEMATPLIASYGHVLSVDVPRRGLAIDGDALRLAQVVGNLLTNAAKFTPSGGAIAITAEVHAVTIALRVRDTGIGISKQMLARLFEPYTQERHTSARASSGLGLGLAIVRSIVEMHGGRVTASSEGLGLGSEFVIELPMSTRPDEAARSTADETRLTRPRASRPD